VPYKCIVTAQNEDGLTVFWKALKHTESIAEIAEDLERLRLRLNRNNAASISPIVLPDTQLDEAVKVIYVDNCCQVSESLKGIFPGVLIKLDVFHWLKRWNDIMFDPKSAHAGIFRGLMSRAIFNVEADEYERAKEKVSRKKKRDATVKEILKEANSVIPLPAVLRSNVEAVLRCAMSRTKMLKLNTSCPPGKKELTLDRSLKDSLNTMGSEIAFESSSSTLTRVVCPIHQTTWSISFG
jgi:hypothetical protein